MEKIKTIQFFNYVILTVGLGLSCLTIFLFVNNPIFPILLMTGASAAICMTLGLSLILDTRKYRNYLKELQDQ